MLTTSKRVVLACGLGLLLAASASAQQPVTQSGGPWSMTISGTADISDRSGRALGSIANLFVLDATLTGRLPAGASPADAESNTNTNLSRFGAFLFGFNGTTWDRLRADTTNGLWVNCKTGCSSSGGSSLTDRAAFTYGTTAFTAIGGVYNSSITALTSGQAGAAALTPTRDLHTALYDASGTALAGQKTSAASIPVVLPSDQFVADATGTLQSAAVATGNGSTLAVGGLSAVMLTVNCATCSGGTTVNFEGTEDGTNYTALQAGLLGTNTIATSTTTSGLTEWEVPIGAVQTIRARISGYSAGTVTVTAHATSADHAPRVVNANVIGTVPISAASGALASGSVASGAIASGAVASGAFASGAISDGADVTLGAKADNKSTATDTTAITLMQVFKEISFMEQNPASRAVTNAGTFATQSAITAASGSIASGAVASGAFAIGSISDGADVTLGAKADAKSTATDTTAVSVMSVLKEISALEQAPASRAVTNAGTFAVQATLQTQTDTVMVGGVSIKEINGVTVSMNTGSPDTGTIRVIPADGVLECAIVSAASTNATNCKAGAGNFVGLELYNTTTTAYYLRLYNTVGAPTCSSATGFIRSIPVPPAGAAGQVGGAIVPIGAGVAYGTGIAFCLTGGSSSTDNTNAAVGIFGAIKYR